MTLFKLKHLSNPGFTLAEMVLVVGIITIIMSIGVPIYLSLSNSNQLDSSTYVMVQNLYQAQSFSRNQSKDSGWGVAVNGHTITLFSGTSYAGRDTSNDVNYTVPSGINFSGSSSIVYTKLYGLPTSGASFTLSAGNKSKIIVVNSKGMLEY